MSLPVLDARVVTSLRFFGGEPGELLHEMALDFLAEAPSLLAEVDRGVDVRAYDTVALAAHRLKGSSGHIGARRLAAAAGEIEASARAGLTTTTARAATSARTELDHALAEVRLLLIPPIAHSGSI